MKKKILFSMLAIAAAAAIVIGGTTAFFSDTETSVGNTFTAGTLDLKLDVNTVANGTFTLTDIKPGQELAPVKLAFTNIGSVEGWVNLNLAFSEADDATYAGEFSGTDWNMSADGFASLVYVKKAMHYDSVVTGGTTGWDVTDAWLAYDSSALGNDDGKLSLYELKQMVNAKAIPDSIFTLTEGKTITLEITFELGDSLDPWAIGGKILTNVPDNRPQADGVQVDITATLDQRTP